jgi:hypothetical protein
MYAHTATGGTHVSHASHCHGRFCNRPWRRKCLRNPSRSSAIGVSVTATWSTIDTNDHRGQR